MKPPTYLFRSSFHLLLRSYSTATPSLIKAQTLPAAAHTGSIKILTLNRPASKNALSRALLHELGSHINAIKSGADAETRVLVIGSEVDGVFCAGADLKERLGFSQSETSLFLAALRSTFYNLSTLPIPTIAAISGVALGGGLELALCTDLRVVSPHVQLGLPETRLGIIPGAGGTYRLPRLVGDSRAKDLIFTGRRVGAIEAVQIGLANRIVDVEEGGGGGGGEGREKTIDAAVEVAQEICFGGPVAVRVAKKAVEGREEKVENRCYEEVVTTEDRDEALVAFREKRRPVFKGR